MTRRNSDERLREIERRVIQGDLGAVLQLHQERKRAGQERDHFSGTSYLVSVPGHGEIMLEPQNERTIMVKFGSQEGIGSGPDYSRRKVDLSPIAVRRLPYSGFGHYGWYEGEGFVPLGPVVPGRTYREDWMRSVDRRDGGFPRPAASASAKDVVIGILTPVVNKWAAEHKREMLEAEAGKASNAVASTDHDVEKAIAVLEEAQQKLSAALIREIEAQAALAGIQPNPPRKSSRKQRGSITFWHGTLREKLHGILESGLEPGEGWGGAGTFGVFLAGSPEGALYWAKTAFQLANDEKMDAERFDRKYGERTGELLAIVSVTIPPEAIKNLRADMEQAEDVGFEGEAEDWEASLEEIGDVMYDGAVPAAWVREVELPT